MTNPTNVWLAPVYSLNNGAWTYTSVFDLLVSTNDVAIANAPIASLDVVIPAGQEARAAVYISRAVIGSTANILESQCLLRAVTSNALPVFTIPDGSLNAHTDGDVLPIQPPRGAPRTGRYGVQ